MKKCLLFIFALIITSAASGVPTLSGTYNIPGGFPTIADAITALNASGVGPGGVTFNVAAGYIENITSTLSITATGTSTNPIIFQKNPLTGGANPRVVASFTGSGTPGTAVQDGIWNLIGSDYVTIDGIDLLDPNSSNPATMEYGYGMFKASPVNGCQYNTIQNCTVTLNRVNNASGSGPALDGSRAINVVNALVTAQTTAVTVTTAAGSNSYNRFYAYTLQNCNIGIALVGYAAATPFTLADQNNDAGGTAATTGNTIINYGGALGATNPAAGVRTQNQYGLNVSWNTINNNNGLGVSHVSTLRGIFTQAATSAGETISHNTLTINGGSTTSQISVIENVAGSTAAGNTININNNTIQNCTWPTATTGAFYGIFNSSTAATVNIFGNIILNITLPTTSSSCYMINGGVSPGPTNLNIYNNEIGNINKTVSGTFYAIFTGSVSSVIPNVSIHDNNIHHMTMGGGGNALYGIHNLTSSTNESYYNNTINNLTNNGTGGIFGIYTNTVAGTRSVYGNTINTFMAAGGSGGNVWGIYCAASSSSVYKNKIYDLSSGTASGIVYGINITSGSVNNVYNNYISDLRTPAANAAIPLVGLYIGGGTAANAYYNTIYLNATGSGLLFGSACIYASTTVTLELRNNIAVNLSTPNGTGIASAYRRSTALLTSYSMSSNNNDFYVGTTSAGQVTFYDGTTTYPTMALYKGLVAPRDNVSFTENPPFVNVAISDLHILTTVLTLCESGGSRVTAPIAVTNDWDLDLRCGEPGYAGTGTAPDVGADEFDGISPLFCFAPAAVTILFMNPTTVLISWVPPVPPPSVGYEYEVRTSGPPGGGPIGLFTSGSTPLTNVTVAGLAGNTTYYVYLRSSCGAGIFSPWTIAYPFTTPVQTIITGTITDSLGNAPPESSMYIQAHTRCNPNDTLSTMNGGISYSVANGIGTYTLNYSQFLNPPAAGEQIFMTFNNGTTYEFDPEMVLISPGGMTNYNVVIRLVRHVHLPFKTSWVRVIVPPHSTLMIHYTYVYGCGNTDVFQWNGFHWVKFRQWNHNHYCTWRYIRNDSNKPQVYVIHNDNGNIWFDMYLTNLYYPTTPSNNNLFALINNGWRDRPYTSCEFGNFMVPHLTFVDYEGASLGDFPQVLGDGGVGSLEVQFESYDNMFWGDMTLMIDLSHVTHSGTLTLTDPDAIFPSVTSTISLGDTAAFFHTGGMLFPGQHSMTLSAGGGLSIGLDGFIYTSVVPYPDLPTVTTSPVLLTDWN